MTLKGAPRLRAKIHVPYESLQTHVIRLHKLHQASDVLRRTSRFVVLARRLQTQMNAMDERVEGSDKTTKQDAEGTTMTINQSVETEDEKERVIAKAALSIAELGMSYFRVRMFVIISLPYAVSLLEGTPDDGSPAQITEDECSVSQTDDDDTIKDISLRSINAVSAYEPFIQDARARVTAEMENMVLTGLKTLVSFFYQKIPAKLL